MSDLRSPEQNYFQSKWWKRKDVQQVLVLWIIFTGLIGYFSTKFQNIAMGKPASETMENVIHLITTFTWASSPVAGFVAALAVEALVQKRHHGDNPPPEAEHEISSSPRATAIWLVISALLCLFALVVGLIALQKDDQALLDRNAIHINVTGQQWAWSYDYPGSTGVKSAVLHLPVDQPVVFHVTSKDVKHSFWVVQMGVKIDANPGYVTQTVVTPNKIGSFDIRCAELCGLLHAYMQNKVIVQSRSDYEKWLSSQPDTGHTTWTPEGEITK
jgi:cytochrome c oxidase subunit 2